MPFCKLCEVMRWTNVWHVVTRHISRTHLLCQMASRLTDAAVRHKDSQLYSSTARTPPAYTLPLSRSGTSLELKTRSRSAPKGLNAFLSRASTSWWSEISLAGVEPTEVDEELGEADRAPA